MERKIIAEIRLAPGEVGYYDDYSRIYLSTTKPTAKIYAGTNTTQILRSIRSGRLRLVSGSLFKKAETPKVKAEPAKVEVKKSEPVAEAASVVEEVKEEVFDTGLTTEEPQEVKTETTTATLEVEAEGEEEKPKRRRSRKKADAE